MTNTSPITTTNFIAGVIGVSIALVIMPNIIIGTVSGSTQGHNRDAAGDLVSDINTVCGNEDEAEGSLEIDANYQIWLEDDTYRLLNDQGEAIDEQTVGCPVNNDQNISAMDYHLESEDDEDDYSISAQ